jgi:hypothetical protein
MAMEHDQYSYVILRDTNAEEIAKDVALFYSRGYRCVGGVAIDGNLYIQAMERVPVKKHVDMGPM